jgi:hypothetical protein
MMPAHPRSAGKTITPFRARLRPAPRDGGFAMDGYWVWCGSCARGEDGRYHLFASRWPKRLPFHPNWVSNSEVVRASADHPSGPYTFEEVVLPPRPGHWDATMTHNLTHNPTIHRHGDTWILFYTGARGIGRDGTDAPPQEAISQEQYALHWLTKRIGIATAPHITGPWTRRDAPILDVRPGEWDSDITSNAAPAVRPDGSVVLVYKSSLGRMSTRDQAPLKLGVAVADHWAGPYRRARLTPLDEFNGPATNIEDPYLWWQDDHYEAIFKDMTGAICGEHADGIHAWSEDGVRWHLADDPLAYSRKLVWDDGTVTHQGQFERVQLLLENGRPTHLFAATGDGAGGFDKMTRTWNMVVPLGGVA